MNSSRWLVLLCLMGAMLFLVAPLDTAAATAYEIDTPVAVSHPALPQVRLTPPSIATRRVPDELRAIEMQVRSAALKFQHNEVAVRASDLQTLLCVLLI